MRARFALTTAALLLTPALAACGGNASDSGDNTVSEDCEPKHEFSTVTDGVLTVSSFDLPPFTKFEGSELTGVDADIINEIAKMECLTVEAQPMDAPNVIPAAQSGRVDIAAGDWYRTAERAAVVSLSAPLYVDQMGIISKDGISSIDDLKGKSVGTVDGYLWVADLQKFLGSDLKTYQSSSAMWQDLLNGRIDIAVDSYASAVFTNDENSADMQIEVAESHKEVAASRRPPSRRSRCRRTTRSC